MRAGKKFYSHLDAVDLINQMIEEFEAKEYSHPDTGAMADE
jgi:hypothetical protein